MAITEGWSGREVETKTRGVRPAGSRRNAARTVSTAHRRVEEALRQRLGTDVRVTAKRKGRGMIAISYYSDDDLARALELILGEPFTG